MKLTIERLLADFNLESIEELEEYLYDLERTVADYKSIKQELLALASKIERRALSM